MARSSVRNQGDHNRKKRTKASKISNKSNKQRKVRSKKRRSIITWEKIEKTNPKTQPRRKNRSRKRKRRKRNKSQQRKKSRKNARKNNLTSLIFSSKRAKRMKELQRYVKSSRRCGTGSMLFRMFLLNQQNWNLRKERQSNKKQTWLRVR